MEVNGQLRAPVGFIAGERAPDTHWIEGWMGPRVGLDIVEKGKISCPSRESNPGRSVHSQLLYRLSYIGKCIDVVAGFLVAI
jgi:hypothetical protein